MGKVSEGDLAACIAEYFMNQEKCSVWIDPHVKGSTYRSHIDDFPAHSISINGYTPDIFAVDRLGMVSAVEVKEAKKIRDGIGQAIVYKRGAHYVYVGGPGDAIEHFKQDILAHGVGVASVTEALQCKLDKPAFSPTPIYITDVLHELELLQIGQTSARRITTLDYAHPVNYLIPVLLFDHDSIEEQVLKEKIKLWGMRNPEKSIRGSLVLGLLRKEKNTLHLAPDGVAFRGLLQRLYEEPLKTLKQFKDREPLPLHDKQLSYMLRLLYLQNPDVRRFVDVLKTVKSERPNALEVLDKAIDVSPNMVINLMIRNEKKEEVLRFFRQNKQKEVLCSAESAKDYLLKNVFSWFKRQLIHVGILDPRSNVWPGDMKTVDLRKDLWIPSKDILQPVPSIGPN